MDVAAGTNLIRNAFPDLRIESVHPIEEGWGSLVLDINGSIIARIARAPWAGRRFEYEERVLEVLRRHLDTPVPSASALIRDADGTPRAQVYEKLPGATVDRDLPSIERVAGQLGRFLARLHAIDPSDFETAGLEADPDAWRQRWVRLASEIEAEVLPMLDVETARGARDFLAARIDEVLTVADQVFIHGDMGGWNILIDAPSSRLTGIIDWGDSGFGDPAFDFTAFEAEYGPEFTSRVLSAYDRPVDDAFRSRIDVYAALHPLYSLLFAHQIGRPEMVERYLEESGKVFGP